ncbi:MAG TPA: NUDIX domain-containing protein [Acidobacteriaceae bacterium]
MQVYLALYDHENDYLIAKKRVTNSWWQGQEKATALVNQAGQWCFPGGAADGNNFIEEAKREFQEETGCVVPTCDSEEVLNPNSSYRLVHCRISGGHLNILMHTANAKVGAGMNPPRPLDGVKDWELSEFTMCPKSRLTAFLGVGSPVPVDISAYPRGKYSQSIDWYGEMARYLAVR